MRSKWKVKDPFNNIVLVILFKYYENTYVWKYILCYYCCLNNTNKRTQNWLTKPNWISRSLSNKVTDESVDHKTNDGAQSKRINPVAQKHEIPGTKRIFKLSFQMMRKCLITRGHTSQEPFNFNSLLYSLFFFLFHFSQERVSIVGHCPWSI